MEKNLFEIATRKNYLFESANGLLSVSDLWVLPLTKSGKSSGANLDQIAINLNREISFKEESFVSDKSEADEDLTNKLELVKHIIKVRKEELRARSEALEKKKQVERLDELILRKKEEEMSSKSLDELIEMRNQITR